MGKYTANTVDLIKEALLQRNVVLYTHVDLVKDLKKLDPYNLKVLIALILKRAELGLSIPPAEPLSGGNLNGYAKIKNRQFPFRGVYTSKTTSDGNEAMYLIAVGPKENEKIYGDANIRAKDEHEYFKI